MARTRIFVEGYQDRVAVISGKVHFEFFPGRGLYTVAFADQAHVLDHAFVAFRTESRLIDSPSYPQVRWRLIDLSDNPAMGGGKAFVVYFSGRVELPALTAEFSFYEGRDLLAVGLQVDNTTGHPFVLDELLPVSCGGKGGGLSFGGLSDCRVFRDNWARLDNEQHLYSLKDKARVDAPNSVLLYDGKGGAALACGIFEPAKCLTSFHLACPEGRERSLEFAARQRPVVGGGGQEEGRGITLRDNQSFSGGRVVLVFDENPHVALEKYGESVGMVNNVPRLERIPCGWACRANPAVGVAEQRVLSHAEFIAGELRRYGLKDILIDTGWQASPPGRGGPWKPGEQFPNGMKSVVEKVHAKGLNIGLWVRPLDFESVRLDPSGKYAKDLWQREAARISQEWGFDFIKIDFLDWDAFDRQDRFLPEDDSATTNEAVRSFLEAMMKGMRPGAFLIGLESAFPATLGIVQGAAVARDVDAARWQTVRESGLKAAALRYHLNNAVWLNDQGYLSINTPATIGQARAWGSLIALSGGCVFVGDSLVSMKEKKISTIKKLIPPFGKAARPIDLLENEAPQIWVLEVEKSFGKWHIVGLFNWDPTPREIEESYRGQVQANVDTLRENDKREGIERPAALHRKIAADNRLIRKENERISSVLNGAEGATAIASLNLVLLRPLRKMRKSPRFRSLSVSLRKLGLDGSAPCLVYDFWADTFLGEHRASLTALVKLAACRVLAVHPRLDHPQFLSSSRHVTQGGVELKDLRWDEGRCELRGQSEIVGGDDYSVTLHVPRNYKFLEMNADCAESKADTRSPHLVRLWFKNAKDKTFGWRAKFEKIR